MEIYSDLLTKPSGRVYESIEPFPEDVLQTKDDTGKKWVRCRSCHFKIALLADKTEIDNACVHIFKNPAGIFYRVVCFSNAPGSINITDYEKENTWFSGYSWSISLCRSCNNHIGWHYDSGSSGFYGLIADRLTGI